MNYATPNARFSQGANTVTVSPAKVSEVNSFPSPMPLPDYLTGDPARLAELRRDFAEHAIVFCNVLGQVRFLRPELDDEARMCAWKRALAAALRNLGISSTGEGPSARRSTRLALMRDLRVTVSMLPPVVFST